MNIYKLGSLFDGSGGFPLSGALCGIVPVWAAEVEPYPIAVTRSRFPNMKHLGDISKVSGADIEPVDIITFGSPCQDLSVAGKRAGLKHEANGDEETTRSGLFMEAVRIIKEMRTKTNGQYPRIAIWENVPGAFSSNNGQDFRVVCEELIKIVEPSASMPEVPKNGWNYADSFVGDGWSLAYRVLDAQYWGVPQRRRRIYLVADFGGESAREILFEREGLRGYFTQGRTPWQAAPADAQGSLGADDREGEGFDGYNGDLTGGVSATLGVNCGLSSGRNGVIERGRLADVGVLNAIGGNAESGQVTDKLPTLTNGSCPGFQNAVAYGVTTKGNGDAFISEERHTALSGGGGQAGQGYPAAMVPYTLKIRTGREVDSSGKCAGKGALVQENISATLATSNDQYLFQPVTDAVGVDAYNQSLTGDKAKTLNSAASDADHVPCTVYSVENHPADSRVNLDESGKVQTLTSRMGTGGGNVPMVMELDKKVSIGLNGESQVSPTLIARMSSAVGTTQDGLILCEEAPVLCMATQQGGAEIRMDNKAPTLTAAAGMSGNNQPVICLQGNGIDRADTAGCNGAGWREGASYTLNTIDRPAVVYAVDQGGGKSGANVTEDKAPTLCTTHGGEPAVAYGLDRASFNQGQNAKFDFTVSAEQQPTLTARGPGAVCCTTGSFTQATEEVAPTLMARDWKDPTVVCSNYIVRRLTPTECARLQGFADWWGVVEQKETLTGEEYRFWLEVRNTHARINGKKEQDYTEKQMLTWYNKLWTDSAEYKMWGNGIALPTALYCVQGAAEALIKTTQEKKTAEEALDDWMN